MLKWRKGAERRRNDAVGEIGYVKNKLEGTNILTRPGAILTRMIGFVLAVLLVAALVWDQLLLAFRANLTLNGLIVLLLLFGIVYAFRQVLGLKTEVNWIEGYQANELTVAAPRPPVLLASMATMLGEHQGRMRLSTMAMRSILDGISSRLDESRDISRYLIGLLIFLGLLGTFWGLLKTVGAVGETIGGLSVGAGDFTKLFADLKAGLESPLAGMSIAFSSSLFGLASSLVLGFLELQASQAQNRFYNELEEWLSTHTRISAGAGSVDGDYSVPVYVQALLEQTADSLENLQRIIARNEDSRVSSHQALLSLSEQLASFTDQMKTEHSVLTEMAGDQHELRLAMEKMANAIAQSQAGGMDEASRNHLRNLDVYMQRLLEDNRDGRDQMISEIRSEIKLLARTIAATSESRRL